MATLVLSARKLFGLGLLLPNGPVGLSAGAFFTMSYGYRHDILNADEVLGPHPGDAGSGMPNDLY